MDTVAYSENRVFKGYKKNEINNLSPVALILKLYDYIIVNSKRRDLSNVNAGLTQLIAALNFDYKEVALGLFRLYIYCQAQARKGNFEEVEKLIGKLRSAWAQAFKLS